jgi:hypothetical protein
MTFMFGWWNWLVEKDMGGLAAAGLLVALAAAIVKILRERAEIRKLRAETRKIDAHARAMGRSERNAEREGVRNCALTILRSVSALVDELYVTFNLFAFPPVKVNKAKLDEAVRLARQFRHEQRYRAEIEGLLAELAGFARPECDGSLSRLGSEAQQLLMKVSDKKALVARIEQGGLNLDTAAAVRTWLSPEATEHAKGQTRTSWLKLT